jgi:hypothetical protein
MTTWRKELEAVDAFPLVGCTLTEAELDVEFDGGYGCREGSIFTAWSATRVFFPVSYDGSEWVGSAPRDPCDESTEHQGG